MRRLPAVAMAALLAVPMSGCKVMQRISDGSFNNAVTDGVVAELRDRGVRLEHRPSCKTPDSGSTSVVRVHCTARTRAGEPITVTGLAEAADTAHPRELYVVTVGGRELFRKDCLGLGCR
ncbi:hypothetical protein [Actinomadura rubrisoli]|uniref:DUF4333 domain-containing protein n=1 Tax=Actinomadura rubrisoli TaxID=2530368 RepID=A0A4V2YZ24_9ACTN|nr:hypothetical protein [Actinomadura rubrisoli]TDD95437.1 hypothetical protein E1298_04830 [Actinomadura rubrisoli]